MLASLVILLGLFQAPLYEAESVAVETVRSYRDGTTLVDGFIRVPFSALQLLPGAGATYQIALTVRDSSGLVLTSSSWSQPVRAELVAIRGASAVEHFTFAADGGRYEVEIVLTDSATGRQSTAGTSVEAYRTAPAASDMMLASSLRRAAAGDSLVHPGEVRKGSFFIMGDVHPVLTPQEEKLSYYLEMYPGLATQADISAAVTSRDGQAVFSAHGQSFPVSAHGGVTASTIDLSGLAPGDYRLALTIHYAAPTRDTTLVREGEFSVAGFDAAAAARNALAAITPDTFSTLSGGALDSLYLPLVNIISEDEKGIYEELSLEGKRNYLRGFWKRRDPTPGTPVNEAEVVYYRTVEEANRKFREGGAGSVPGWRTDRGRILIRYGEPDEVKSRTSGISQPYEFWKYTRGRQRIFIFIDRTGLGHYELIYTNERREPSDPRWESIVGPEIRDLM